MEIGVERWSESLRMKASGHSKFNPLPGNPCGACYSKQHDLMTDVSSRVRSKDQSLPRTSLDSWRHWLGNREAPETLRWQILNSAPSVTETNIDIRRVALYSCQAAKISYFTPETCQQSNQMKLHLSKLQSNYPIRLNMAMSNNCMRCNSLC